MSKSKVREGGGKREREARIRKMRVESSRPLCFLSFFLKSRGNVSLFLKKKSYNFIIRSETNQGLFRNFTPSAK